MLLLHRKAEQTIHIGSDVVIRVVDIRGSKVILGIEAPQEIKVQRGEIYAAIASSLEAKKRKDRGS